MSDTWAEKCLTPCPGRGYNVALVTARTIDGKALAAKVREEVALEIAELGHVGLATVLVGDDPASDVYIRGKHKAAQAAGIDARDMRLPADTPKPRSSSSSPSSTRTTEVDGILVQLPLPGRTSQSRRSSRRSTRRRTSTASIR